MEGADWQPMPQTGLQAVMMMLMMMKTTDVTGGDLVIIHPNCFEPYNHVISSLLDHQVLTSTSEGKGFQQRRSSL